MMSQIEQAKQQYESLTGSRGLGNIMNNPALRDYLPGDWQAVYDSLRAHREQRTTHSLRSQSGEASARQGFCTGCLQRRKEPYQSD
ncbi:hypothetical protein G6F66_015407 [Rhizopus arrhizus]|nr:hypothetical protein G6F66_015407 [Rhizopus arrhizus]KAG1476320.1 hypothetical protein G6F54_014173 [Rhizopus delemar]